MVLQCGQNSVRDAADSDLEGSSVRDHFSDMATDGRVYLGRCGGRNLNERVIHLNGSVYAGHMDQSITV